MLGKIIITVLKIKFGVSSEAILKARAKEELGDTQRLGRVEMHDGVKGAVCGVPGIEPGLT